MYNYSIFMHFDQFYNLNLSSAQRFEKISEFFLGQPYLRGALGEGAEARFDQSPLFRADAFDCLTYVNTVLALFFSQNWRDFHTKIAALNYRHGNISYENRHHFMSVDWNKENSRLGFIQDRTREIKNNRGKSLALLSKTLIDRPNWFRCRQLNDLKLTPALEMTESLLRLDELRSLGDELAPEWGIVPYLPWSDLFDVNHNPTLNIFKQIKHGAIIEIVRPQWDLRAVAGTYLDISHVGFAVWKEDELFFREASMRLKKVADTPFISYLQSLLNESTIQGINIQIFM